MLILKTVIYHSKLPDFQYEQALFLESYYYACKYLTILRKILYFDL